MIWSVGLSAGMGALVANPIASVVGAMQFTPRQLGIMAGSLALVAIANFVQKNPWPERAVSIALLPGVHTPEDVKLVMKSTSPGVVPTKEHAAAIIADAKDGD